MEQRYLPTYRRDEIGLILDCAYRGESLCLIGVAGVGKSNVINYLRHQRQWADRSNPDMSDILFAIGDMRTWKGTPASLWQLMDSALRETATDLAPTFQDNRVVSISEEERGLHRLRARLTWACQEIGIKVMFVLDDADLMFSKGPPEMLEQLNALRSEGKRGLLSFLIFTKRLPHVLGKSFDLEHNSKFFDLFRHNQFALAPYSPVDARQMLKHLNTTVLSPLSSGELPRIQELAGGHARLLRILFDLWIQEGPPPGNSAEDYLLNKPSVRQECERIWRGLHPQEQKIALVVAQSMHAAEHAPTVHHLVRRGLLVEQGSSGQLAWFSPLMGRFLNTYTPSGGSG